MGVPYVAVLVVSVTVAPRFVVPLVKRRGVYTVDVALPRLVGFAAFERQGGDTVARAVRPDGSTVERAGG